MAVEPGEQITYTPWFNPPTLDEARRARKSAGVVGDRADEPVYVYDEKTIRAVNVAGVTGRPLLVEGPSGCGKSSLAEHLAHIMDWEFIRYTVTSRTQAGDLLYRIDQLKRLRDAQAEQNVEDMSKYIEAGELWKAFDRDSAATKSASKPLPKRADPYALPGKGKQNGTVVLLDEIDKADPDVPNNLLLPLGSYKFRVDELGFEVLAQRVPLVVLTTNNERKLPDAFLRRCVNLTVSRPDKQRYVDAGLAHYPNADRTRIEAIADVVSKGATDRTAPSTAEFLDTLRASLTLNIIPGDANWDWLTQITAWKPVRRMET